MRCWNNSPARCSTLPTPGEANERPFGVFASAISSGTVRALTSGLVARMKPSTAQILVTASKLVLTSNGSVRWKLGLTTKDDEVTSSVLPSGAASATTWAPIMPSAPARLSTMKVLPVWVVSCWAMMRATMSGDPPAANGTITRTGLSG